MIPVSIRTGEEEERWTNRVSAIFASIPTDEADPVARVGAVHEAMDEAKDRFDAAARRRAHRLRQFPPPAVATRAIRLATRLCGRFGYTVQPGDLERARAPGAALPGRAHEVLHYYPVSTIVEGQGLNVTVQSYFDVLDFGLVSCRELVPDLWDLRDAIVDDVVTLGKAAGVDVDLSATG